MNPNNFENESFDDASIVIFHNDLDKMLFNSKHFFNMTNTFPFISLRYIKRGVGITSYFCNRLVDVKDSLLVVKDKFHRDKAISEYGTHLVNRVCTLIEIPATLKSKTISEIYFDNVNVDVLEKKHALLYLPNLRKLDSLVVDVRQVNY